MRTLRTVLTPGISEHVDWKILHLSPPVAIAAIVGLVLLIGWILWLVLGSGKRR